MTDSFFAKLNEIRSIVASQIDPVDKLASVQPKLLGDKDLLREFWNLLDDSKWLRALSDAKMFDNPPAAVFVDKETRRFPNWPASKYLRRIANQDPNGVTSVLAHLNSDNSSVIADLIDIALAVPVNNTVLLLPVIVRAANDATLWMTSRAAVDVCVKLAKHDRTEEALEYVEALFGPKIDSHKDLPSSRDTYWHKEGLGILTPLLAVQAPQHHLNQLCQWLESMIRSKDYVQDDSDEDFSYSWRPAIEEHSENHDWDLAGSLVGITRTGFEAALDQSAMTFDESLAILDRFNLNIYRRIRIYLIAKYAEQNTALARQTMMNKELFEDYRFNHEYAMLVFQRLPMLEPSEMEEWYGWIDDGPDLSGYEERIQERSGRPPTTEERQRRIDYWKYEKLHWARLYLTGNRKTFYTRMLAEHGEPALSDLNARTTSYWGSESPMTVEDLADKTLQEVVQIIDEWEPEDSERHWGPDIEGLARVFSQYIAQTPSVHAQHAEALKDSKPIIVRSFIQEMTGALKNGLVMDIRELLELATWVLDQPASNGSQEATSQGPLVDKDWRWTRDEISGFIEEVCKSKDGDQPRFSEASYREALWKLLKQLYTDPSDSGIIHDRSDDDPCLHDYLNHGINSSRGKALQAAFEYARWVANHRKILEDGREVVPGGFDLMPEVRQMLKWQLDPDRRSVEAMSVIGSRIGLLFWIDREWLDREADALFNLEGIDREPAVIEGWAAWNAYLVWGQPHIEFYKIFKKQFAFAVEKTIQHSEIGNDTRSKPLHRLGEHLVLLYGRGQVALDQDDQLIRRFILESAPAIRRHTIGFVGRSVCHDEKLPQEVAERFQKLWELYWAGPGKQDAADAPTDWLFGHWFASKQFPAQWALSQLQDFTDVVGIPEPDHDVAEYLAELVDDHLESCVTILGNMIHGDHDRWHVRSWIESAEAVLKAGLAGSEQIRSKASDLVNLLGRRGYTHLGALLKA